MSVTLVGLHLVQLCRRPFTPPFFCLLNTLRPQLGGAKMGLK